MELERSSRHALIAASIPLAFTIYLAAVPYYGAHVMLLFGFLLLVDVGLLAITVRRTRKAAPASAPRGPEEWLHVAGAVTTVTVFPVWIANSYEHQAWLPAILFTAAFVLLYSLAPLVASFFDRPLGNVANHATRAAPVLLFVFASLLDVERTRSPAVPFGVLFALLALLSWRAIWSGDSALYFIAAVFVIVSEAIWSLAHLFAPSPGTALVIYGIFGALFVAVPVAARRVNRPLTPAWGTSAVQLTSLMLLLFLSPGGHTTTAACGIAPLLAIGRAHRLGHSLVSD